MDRRKFLKDAGLGLTGAGLVAGCGSPQEAGSPAAGSPAVHTRENVTWRLTSSFPRGLDTFYGSAELLAGRLEALSEGRFRLRVYPAGEIVPALQVLDAVQQGTAQVGQTASYYFIGKNPALAFDACVPFGLTTRQQNAWLAEGGGRALMDELFADFNVLSFNAGSTGAQMGGWFKREIGSVADLEGLKMRIPGLGGEVMSRLGVTVQVLAGGDIYPALERGAIDATEWVGPYDDEKLGFHQVAKYYYYPGWWEPGPSLSYYVNRDAWQKLPKTHQEMFRAAARESAVAMQERYDHRNPQALARLIEQGVELRPFSEDLLEAARRTTLEMLEEQAAADATYRKVYEQWKKARADLYRWFGTSELAFARHAFTAD